LIAGSNREGEEHLEEGPDQQATQATQAASFGGIARDSLITIY
jgi:hypothetical protein